MSVYVGCFTWKESVLCVYIGLLERRVCVSCVCWCMRFDGCSQGVCVSPYVCVVYPMDGVSWMLVVHRGVVARCEGPNVFFRKGNVCVWKTSGVWSIYMCVMWFNLEFFLLAWTKYFWVVDEQVKQCHCSFGHFCVYYRAVVFVLTCFERAASRNRSHDAKFCIWEDVGEVFDLARFR